MNISYDEKADVLYVTLKACEKETSEHRGDGIIVSEDIDTGEVVGYTIMGYSEKEEKDLPINLEDKALA